MLKFETQMFPAFLFDSAQIVDANNQIERNKKIRIGKQMIEILLSKQCEWINENSNKLPTHFTEH